MAHSPFSIEDVLGLLNERRLRATYAAVGGVIGIPAQSVGTHLGPRVPRASWVVNKKTRQPSGYLPNQIHSDLLRHGYVIETAVELLGMLSKRPVQKIAHPTLVRRHAPRSGTSSVLVGLDLAWHTHTKGSGIAVGILKDGVLSVTDVCHDVIGIDNVLARIPKETTGIAIDAPLIIRNLTSSRSCEKALSRVYSRVGAGCHTSNTTRFPNAASVQLSSSLKSQGFDHCGKQRWQIEVYPHPALIEVFGLDYRLPYKKGKLAERRLGQIRLAQLVKSLARSSRLKLRLPSTFEHHVSPSWIRVLPGVRLKANEDALDAIICLYIAGLYALGEPMQIFGDIREGYIIVPNNANLTANREPGSKPCR